MSIDKQALDPDIVIKKFEESVKFLSSKEADSLLCATASHGFRSSSTLPDVKFDGSTERGSNYHTSNHIKDRIAACREAYENSGIIGNAIDLMVDFALEGFDIVHTNPAIQNFYRAWASRVGLIELSSQILKCYFRDGNVPVLSFRGRIKKKEFQKLQKAVAKSIAGNLLINDDVYAKIIPYRYHVLDVLSIEKDGSELLGTVRYKYQINSEDLKPIQSDDNIEYSFMLKKLREAIGDENFDYLKDSGYLRLSPDRLSMLYYKKDDYRSWSSPMFWRIIGDIKFKKLLRDMDVSVCESVINTLVIIALGNTPEGFPASPEMLKNFANLMKTPTKSQTLIWNDFIKIIAEYPPVDKILGKDKYDQVDADIRAGIGIAEVVLNGQGNNYANSFLSVKTLMERLENGRTVLITWLENEVFNIAKAMGFKQPAWFKMHHMSLRDEEAEKRLILELVDRGMVSYETAVATFGENFNIEIERMKREDDFRRQNEKKYPFVINKVGKFGPQVLNGPIPVFELLDAQTIDQGFERQGLTPKQSPTQQGDQGQKGGRPSGTKKPQDKKAEPRNAPKGQKTAADLSVESSDYMTALDMASSIWDAIYNKFNIDNISSDNQIKACNLIVKLIDAFDKVEDVKGKKINELVKSKYVSSIFGIYEKLLSDHVDKMGSYPSLDTIKEMAITSLAIKNTKF